MYMFPIQETNQSNNGLQIPFQWKYSWSETTKNSSQQFQIKSFPIHLFIHYILLFGIENVFWTIDCFFLKRKSLNVEIVDIVCGYPLVLPLINARVM